MVLEVGRLATLLSKVWTFSATATVMRTELRVPVFAQRLGTLNWR